MSKLNLRHVKLICFHWTNNAMRSGSGLVYLVVTLMFGLFAANAIVTPVEMMLKEAKKEGQSLDRQQVIDFMVQRGQPAIEWVLDIEAQEPVEEANPFAQPAPPEKGSWVSFLLYEKPALLSALFLILLFGMPFVITFLGYNQISGDTQHRGLRYLLLRTERTNIFFGRFLGTAIFSTAVIALLIAVVTLYLGVNMKIYSAGALVGWGLYGFVALSVLMLPYIALCSMISASVDTPMVSMVFSKLIIVGVLVAAAITGKQYDWGSNIKHLLPWGIQNYLLHPDIVLALGAVLGCLGYTAAFLMLGHWRFQKRDL